MPCTRDFVRAHVYDGLDRSHLPHHHHRRRERRLGRMRGGGGAQLRARAAPLRAPRPPPPLAAWAPRPDAREWINTATVNSSQPTVCAEFVPTFATSWTMLLAAPKQEPGRLHREGEGAHRDRSRISADQQAGGGQAGNWWGGASSPDLSQFAPQKELGFDSAATDADVLSQTARLG
jgi:hypothetical protein